MTMYLPNPDLRSTGSEAAEFIEVSPMAEDTRAPIERRERTTMRLDVQTRLNITRWADEYISGLVENHNGDREDVGSIIHELQDESAFAEAYVARSLPNTGDGLRAELPVAS